MVRTFTDINDSRILFSMEQFTFSFRFFGDFRS